MASTPILPYAQWLSGTNQNSIPANDNSMRSEIFQRNVNNATTAQPVSPSDGDCYIIQSTHTGTQWATFTPKDLAIYKGGTWYAFAPAEGNRVSVSGVSYIYTSGAWTSAGGGGVSDGDKGDITVSSGGTVWTVDNQAITYAKMQNISAQYRLLGRNSASAGVTEEVTLSQLLDWVGSAANGDILMRSAGAWTRLGIGSTGNVLTVASGLPSWAAPSGGGGLTNFTEALNTASPNNSTNTASLTLTTGTTDGSVALVAKAQGATLAQVANNATGGGNIRGIYATDWQKSRSAATMVASGVYSTIGGGLNNRASSASTTIAGGEGGIASNSYATVAGGFNNTASNTGSAVVGGSSATASGTYSVAGGNTVTASGNAAVGFGATNTASGNYSMVIGQSGLADGLYSFVHGQQGSARGLIAARVHSASSHNSQGQLQALSMVLRGSSNSNTGAIALTADGNAAGTTNMMVLPNATSMTVTGRVVARNSVTLDSAHWTFAAAIKRGANAAATSMVAACTPVLVAADSGASTWGITVTADTTNGGLLVQFTGQTGANIRVGCSLDNIECNY